VLQPTSASALASHKRNFSDAKMLDAEFGEEGSLQEAAGSSGGAFHSPINFKQARPKKSKQQSKIEFQVGSCCYNTQHRC
jgi:hypothetical protein